MVYMLARICKRHEFADSCTSLQKKPHLQTRRPICRLGVFFKSRLQTRLPSTVSKLVTTCLQMGRPIAISKDCTQRVSDPCRTSWPWQFRRFRRFRGGFMAVSWRFQPFQTVSTVSNHFNRFTVVSAVSAVNNRFSRFGRFSR